MKKSILSRLITGSLLLLVTIALLALCFLAGVRLDRTMADDVRRLSAIQERVQFITLRASMLSSAGTPEQLRSYAHQMRSADEELLRLVGERTSSAAGGALLYSAELREALTVVHATLGSTWQAELQRIMDAGNDAFESEDVRARFLALVPAFLANGENLAGQLSSAVSGIYEARRSLASSVLALFALFVGIGTFSALAHSLWTLFVLRRDMRNLITLSQKVSEGDFSGFPEVRREDEIGELAEQLRKLSSLQAVVTTLQRSGARLGAEYSIVADRISRTVSGVKGQAKVVEEASRGFAAVAQTVKQVKETASAGIDAAKQGASTVEASLEKITRGMDSTRALEERTSRIEEAVSVIGDVADQTELLSLNAAIEAARAGETGRGFTVVAQQVRKLADRSARSASEIGDLVQGVLDGVRRMAGDSKESMEAAHVLRKELARVTAATTALSALAASAAEGLGKVESSLGAVLGAAADTSRRADDLAASSRSLQAIVEEIDRALGRFSRETRGMIKDIPSAAHEALSLPPFSEPLPLSLGITPVEPAEETMRGTEIADQPLRERPAVAEAVEAEEIEELESAEED